MFETGINRAQVLKLLDNNGFEYNSDTKKFEYEDDDGVKLEFPIVWLDEDETKLYDLASVRQYLIKLLDSVKLHQQMKKTASDQAFMDDVSAALKEFGMEYDTDNDLFAYQQNGVYIFTAPLDYIVATVLSKRKELEAKQKELEASPEMQNDKPTTKKLVTTVLEYMRDDAIEERKEKEANGNKENQSAG
jgi:hypothetical protein